MIKLYRIEYQVRKDRPETRGFDTKSELITFIREIVSNPDYRITNIKKWERVLTAKETFRLLYAAKVIHKPAPPPLTQPPVS